MRTFLLGFLEIIEDHQKYYNASYGNDAKKMPRLCRHKIPKRVLKEVFRLWSDKKELLQRSARFVSWRWGEIGQAGAHVLHSSRHADNSVGRPAGECVLAPEFTSNTPHADVFSVFSSTIVSIAYLELFSFFACDPFGEHHLHLHGLEL